MSDPSNLHFNEMSALTTTEESVRSAATASMPGLAELLACVVEAAEHAPPIPNRPVTDP